MTKKNKLIDRINNQFKTEIPKDYPIRSHQRKLADSGGFNWYFNGENREYNAYGSCFTITELLKHKEYELFEEGSFIELIPKCF